MNDRLLLNRPVELRRETAGSNLLFRSNLSHERFRIDIYENLLSEKEPRVCSLIVRSKGKK